MFFKKIKSAAATNQSGAIGAGTCFTCASQSASKTAVDDRDHFTCSSFIQSVSVGRSASKNGARSKSLMSRGNILRRALLSALCIITFMGSCFAQDIIVMKDARRIYAKEIEVNVDNVRYKDFNNQEGTVQTLLKSDIASINYENGEQVTFGTGNPRPTPFNPPTTADRQTTASPTVEMLPPAERLTADGRKVYQSGRQLTQNEVRGLMANMDAIRLYNKGLSRNKNGNIALIAGLGVGVVGGVILPFVFPERSYYVSYYGYENEYVNEGYNIAMGVPCCIVGGLSVIGGVTLKILSVKSVSQSVYMYNRSGSRASTELKFGITGNGVGLALCF